MNKCSPVEMRKNLEMVRAFKEVGIDFVAVPVFSETQKHEMLLLASGRLDSLENTTDIES